MPYDPTIYLGSAAHYRNGRPAYSPELEALLTQEAGLDGSGRLLDAGCSPPATPPQSRERAGRTGVDAAWGAMRTCPVRMRPAD